MQFSLSKAWNDAIAMLSANREVVLIIAGVFFFLPGFLSAFIMEGSQDLATLMDPAAQEEAMALMARYWWVYLLSLVGQAVGTFSLLALLRSADKPTVGEAIQGSFRCIGSGFLIYILLVVVFAVVVGIILALVGLTNSYAVAALLGTAAFVALAYLMVRLSLVAPVLAIEKVLHPIAALKRSFALTKGHSGRLLAFYVLLSVAYVVITVPFILIIGGLGLLLGDAAGLLIASLVGAALGAVVAALFIGIQASVHRQLSADTPSSHAGFQFD